MISAIEYANIIAKDNAEKCESKEEEEKSKKN